jgi:beta-glucosidase
VLIVAGYTAVEEGEYIPGDINLGAGGDAGGAFARGGDRASLELPEAQVRLIEAAAEAGKPLVVAIVAGSAVLMESWLGKAGAILQTFYAGMEGGTALAQLLFGEVSPSGKLPFTVAKSAEDYVFFDRDADSIVYDQWHGYTHAERRGVAPRFPFGHGLSYATFVYRALNVRRIADALHVSVSVRNDGKVRADEVVQLYVAPPGVAAERPRQLLKAFQRVTLAPGETCTVRLSVPLSSLRWWNPAARSWAMESGAHGVLVGGSSDDARLLRAEVDL